MKILIASHIGYPWGGIAHLYNDLLESTLSTRVDLTFFESSPNKKSFSTTGVFNLQNVINFILLCFGFNYILTETKPEIVHIATAHGLSFLKNSILIIISKLHGAKVILAPHCSITVFVPKSKLSMKWMQFVLNKCDGLVVLSNEWLSIIKLAPNIKIELLVNSINLSKYLLIDRNCLNKKVRIIFLGHIGKEKGVFDLVHAIKEIVDQDIIGFELILYGETLRPGEMELLRNMVNEFCLDDIVSICKPIFDDEKIEAYKQADIFVLPSHSEGMPISIIEAMAAGLPIVATNVGGIPDLVKNLHNGIIIKPRDTNGLANALLTLIGDPKLRHLYGMAGRKIAIEQHDIRNYVSRLFNYYQSFMLPQ